MYLRCRLMAACALADTRKGPVIIRPAAPRNRWLTCDLQHPVLEQPCHRRVGVRLDALSQISRGPASACAWSAQDAARQDLCISSRTGMTVAGKSGQAGT